MSSVQNVAATTLTLTRWLLEFVRPAHNTAEVQANRLDKIDQKATIPIVNVFLYEISKNQGYAGIDLPTRRGEGTLATKPLVAVDLHYLLSFTASSELLAQDLMARIVRAIHAKPRLTPTVIRAAIATDPNVQAATLADQEDVVKLSLPPMPLDEMNKLWGMFPSTPYMLSVKLLVTTAILESDFDPEPALPVRSFGASVIPSLEPSISAVSAKGRDGVIFAADTLLVFGNGLDATGLIFELDNGSRATSLPSTENPGAREVTFPPNTPAGVRTIVAEMPTTIHPITSAALPFLLRPTINSASMLAGSNLRVTFRPALQVDQVAHVILTKVDGAIEEQYRFEMPSAGRPYTTRQVNVSTIPAGRYLVRLRIDGAESLLTFHTTSPRVRPQVTR